MADTATSMRDAAEDNDAAVSAAEVKDKLDKLSRDIAELTRVVTAFGSSKVEEASTRATEFGAEVADRSAAAIASAREGVASLEHDLENHIRARPIQAVAIAAGIGFVAALLTRR